MKTTFNDVVSSKVLWAANEKGSARELLFRFQPASLSENFSQSPIVVAFQTAFVPNHHGFSSWISAAQQRTCVHRHQNKTINNNNNHNNINKYITKTVIRRLETMILLMMTATTTTTTMAMTLIVMVAITQLLLLILILILILMNLFWPPFQR